MFTTSFYTRKRQLARSLTRRLSSQEFRPADRQNAPGNRVTSLLWSWCRCERKQIVFDDRKTLLVFLRSLDARGKDLASAVHWAVSDDLGKRTYFQIGDGHRAKLKVTKVTFKDQGIFRCRVDFINSPTRNFRVNLTLVGEYRPKGRTFDRNRRNEFAFFSFFQKNHPDLWYTMLRGEKWQEWLDPSWKVTISTWPVRCLGVNSCTFFRRSSSCTVALIVLFIYLRKTKAYGSMVEGR